MSADGIEFVIVVLIGVAVGFIVGHFAGWVARDNQKKGR